METHFQLFNIKICLYLFYADKNTSIKRLAANRTVCVQCRHIECGRADTVHHPGKPRDPRVWSDIRLSYNLYDLDTNNHFRTKGNVLVHVFYKYVSPNPT